MKTGFRLLRMFMIVLVAITMVACNNNDDDNAISDCTEAVCTEVFITLTVFVQDQNEDVVVLDSFQVINLENGTDVTPDFSDFEFEQMQEFGSYPLTRDGFVPMNEVQVLRFKGFMSNVEVATRDFTVSADCCHVDWVAGDRVIVID